MPAPEASAAGFYLLTLRRHLMAARNFDFEDEKKEDFGLRATDGC
jgi:hypothetical protein